MKKLLVLLFIVFAVFVVYNRHRLFLRDPLAKVMRNGVKEDGAQVFINYDNSVLIENDNAPVYVEVVTHDHRGGGPLHLKCVHYIACLTEADDPTLIPPADGIEVESTSSRTVMFHEGKRETVVTLY